LNFSRRIETQPCPPLPACTCSTTRSTKLVTASSSQSFWSSLRSGGSRAAAPLCPAFPLAPARWRSLRRSGKPDGRLPARLARCGQASERGRAGGGRPGPCTYVCGVLSPARRGRC
jgi:hypothetical protein